MIYRKGSLAQHRDKDAASVEIGRPRRRPAGLISGGLFPVLALFVLAAICTGCASTAGAASSGTPVSATPVAIASWPELLPVAQREANKIDDKAALDWVIALYKPEKLTNNEPDNVFFYFTVHSGNQVEIVLRDTSPPAVVSVNPHFQSWGREFTDQDLANLSTLTSVIKVGPREVANLALKQREVATSDLSVSMYSFQHHESAYGERLVWSILYDTSPTSYVIVRVSPVTGKVLGIEER